MLCDDIGIVQLGGGDTSPFSEPVHRPPKLTVRTMPPSAHDLKTSPGWWLTPSVVFACGRAMSKRRANSQPDHDGADDGADDALDSDLPPEPPPLDSPFEWTIGGVARRSTHTG